MTLDEFCEITRSRIPTPAEFVEFAESMNWRLDVRPDGTGSLYGDRNDPLAVAFARMLSREPYRTNVVALLRSRGPVAERKHEKKAEARPEAERQSCSVCNRDVSDPEDRERLRGVNPFCPVGQARGVAADGHGNSHPASPGCPYRGTSC